MDTSKTIVTAFIDINRGSWDGFFKRGAETYFAIFQKWVTIKHPKVIYVDSKYYDAVLQVCYSVDAEMKYHKLIKFDLENCEFYFLKDRIQENIKSVATKLHRETLKPFPEFSQPNYIIVIFQKLIFMYQVVKLNIFNSENFVWFDFGCAVFEEQYIGTKIFENTKFKSNKIRCISFTDYDDLEKNVDFSKYEYFLDHNNKFIIGAFFGGDTYAIKEFYNIFRVEAYRILAAGSVTSEQYIYIKNYFENPDLFDSIYVPNWDHPCLSKFILGNE